MSCATAVLKAFDLPCKVYHFSRIDSTNQKLKEWLPPEDTAIYADFQTAGRGQGDHIWHCRDKQGLLMSLLYHPPKELCAETLLKISAIAVCRSINHYLQGTSYVATIKAPNDILVNGSKLAGILLENIYQGKQLSASVIGIGVNLCQKEFPGSDYARTPVSMKQLGIAVDTEELLIAILNEFYALLTCNNEEISLIYDSNIN